MTEQDPMAVAPPKFDPAQASPERAAEQVEHAAWPKPGDEGYVHPDGTPQSAAQLADNIRAAQDRAAAGSIVHGAPAVQHGGRPDATSIAQARADAYSGPTNDDRDEALTTSVREGQAALAETSVVDPEAPNPNDGKPPADTKRSGGTATADPSGPQQKRD